MVYSFGGRRGDVIGMGVPKLIREEKCGKGYRHNIQERPEEDTGEWINWYSGRSKDTRRHEFEEVIEERFHSGSL